MAASTPSTVVPTANEMKAALTGEATALASRALVGAWSAVAPPARTTTRMANRDGFMAPG